MMIGIDFISGFKVGFEFVWDFPLTDEDDRLYTGIIIDLGIITVAIAW